MTDDVLIVEDDGILAVDLQNHLTAAGYRVCGIAPTAGKAFDLAGQCRLRMAVVDIRLADGDGIEVALALWDIHGTCSLRDRPL
jgi:two-component system, response regulator PdtaR